METLICLVTGTCYFLSTWLMIERLEYTKLCDQRTDQALADIKPKQYQNVTLEKTLL